MISKINNCISCGEKVSEEDLGLCASCRANNLAFAKEKACIDYLKNLGYKITVPFGGMP